MNYKYFASESVSAGHPDKICDAIADACLDSLLKKDPLARTGIECLVTSNKVVVSGEIKTKAKIDFKKTAQKVIKNLGYNQPIYHFDYHTVKIKNWVHQQSPDIALGVDAGGAGDQGLMFGYACRETKQLMPLPIMLAHGLVKKMDEVKKDKLSYLRPDGKSQVVVKYEKGKPVCLETVILAVPFDVKINKNQAKKDLFKYVVEPVLREYKIDSFKFKKMILNGTGQWEIGGPHSDMGETGRKIIVDSYGGMARVGGGCFSGKDPTKVDRSGAYAARFIAKNIVAAGLADRCEVQIAYVIGHQQPVAKAVETFGTAKKPLKTIADFAWKLLDLSVKGIINGLNLRQPIYLKTAAYGHFGRPQFPWEKIVV